MGGPKNPKQPSLSLIWDQMHSVPLGCEMRQLQLRLPKFQLPRPFQPARVCARGVIYMIMR